MKSQLQNHIPVSVVGQDHSQMEGQTSSELPPRPVLSDLLGLIQDIPHPSCTGVGTSAAVEAAGANQDTCDLLQPLLQWLQQQGGVISRTAEDWIDLICTCSRESLAAADLHLVCSSAYRMSNEMTEESEPPSEQETNSNTGPGSFLCLTCDSCKYKIQLDRLKRDIFYIQDSLKKQSSFEVKLASYIQTLDLAGRIEEGSSLPESSLRELSNAVMQLKFQLPSASSYYKLPENPPEVASNHGGAQTDTSILSRNYDDLSNEEWSCLFCFSVFSGEVKKRVLINWWIGQNSLSVGSETKLEQEGEKMLTMLKNRQIIQQVRWKNRPADSWVMEPLSRLLLRSRANAENFSDFIGRRKGAKAILLRSDTPIGNLTAFKEVKTIFNIDKSSFTDTEAETLAYMENLVVLHLGRSQSVPRRIIRVKNLKMILKRLHKMKNLRLLSLRGITTIRELPDSVCKLASLVVLDLSECQALNSLPSMIGVLKCLTHLDVSGCPLLLQMPKGIRSLLQLEVLKGFAIGPKAHERSSCSLGDLCMLKKLHKLSILIRKEGFPQPQDLKHLINIKGLVKLKIVWKAGSMQGQQNDDSAPDGYKQGEPDAGPAVDETVVESVVNGYSQQHQGSDDERAVTRDVNSAPDDYEQGEPNADPAVNETDVESVVSGYSQQQHQGNDDERAVTRDVNSAPDDYEQGEPNAEPAVNNTDIESVVNGYSQQHQGNDDERVQGKNHRLRKMLPSCFRNQVEVHKRVVPPRLEKLEKLEKLDLWCPPDATAGILLRPNNFAGLSKLYIRGAKFKGMSASCTAEMKWQNVKTLRLLFLSELRMEQDRLKHLFPELEYLELRDCPNVRFPECDGQGVWEKTIPTTSSNIPSL